MRGQSTTAFKRIKELRNNLELKNPNPQEDGPKKLREENICCGRLAKHSKDKKKLQGHQ